jgi:hypothetical protein
MSIHSRNDQVILEFGLKKPAFRIVVNTPTTHGSIGLTTGLDPSMTLGCGGWGGNITSDNISPKHLLNIKRLAYEIRPATSHTAAARPASTGVAAPAAGLPRVAPPQVGGGLDTAAMARQVAAVAGAAAPPPSAGESGSVVSFVCEDDVRQAVRLGRRIVIGERTIITPAARDLANEHKIFVLQSWPR